MKIRSAEFVSSHTHWEKCPTGLPAIALIGRSNVGKSSLINALVQRRKLAKTSGTPGKTQLINYFLINKQWHLVDLPGYGWAQVSKKQKAEWQKMTKAYFSHCQDLLCVWVLVDVRLPPQEKDLVFINQLGRAGIPLSIVLTKADKCKQREIAANQKALATALKKDWEALPPFFLTSSEKGTGMDALLGYVSTILDTTT